jgi:hypothetical protein
MRVISPKGLNRNLSNARLTLSAKARHEWAISKAVWHDKLAWIQIARGEYRILGPQSTVEDVRSIKLHVDINQRRCAIDRRSVVEMLDEANSAGARLTAPTATAGL